jgi:hypothetical protein
MHVVQHQAVAEHSELTGVGMIFLCAVGGLRTNSNLTIRVS